MSIHIGIARSPLELDAVFRLRHQVFVAENGYTPQRSKRLVDRFDAFPGVVSITATVDEEIVGSVRFMECSPAGASTDDYFDFGPHLPGKGRVGACSQFVVLPEYREVPGLIFSMIARGYAWARQRGLTHLTAVAKPELGPVFQQSGWRLVGEEFLLEDRGLRCQPAMLDLADLNDRCEDFIRRQRVDHVFSEFERVLYRSGEVLCRIGDPAEHAFVVVEGELKIANAVGRELARLGPGELVGEIALLTNQRRTAQVEAACDTWLMMLSRSDFDRQLRERPEAARAVLELLAHRLALSGAGPDSP